MTSRESESGSEAARSQGQATFDIPEVNVAQTRYAARGCKNPLFCMVVRGEIMSILGKSPKYG